MERFQRASRPPSATMCIGRWFQWPRVALLEKPPLSQPIVMAARFPLPLPLPIQRGTGQHPAFQKPKRRVSSAPLDGHATAFLARARIRCSQGAAYKGVVGAKLTGKAHGRCFDRANRSFITGPNGCVAFPSQGDPGDELFFIQHGQVDVVSEDGSRVFASMSGGEFFGTASSETRRECARVWVWCPLPRPMPA